MGLKKDSKLVEDPEVYDLVGKYKPWVTQEGRDTMLRRTCPGVLFRFSSFSFILSRWERMADPYSVNEKFQMVVLIIPNLH